MFPLSADQLSLWTAHELESRGCSTRIVVRLAIGVPVDETKLRDATQAYVDAHPMARATIGTDAEGRHVNVIHEEVTASFAVIDLTGLDERQLDGEVTRLAEAPFADDARSLHRFALLRTDGLDEFLWVIDHVVSDGWSSFVGFMQILGGLAAGHKGETPSIRTPRTTYASIVEDEAARLASAECRAARDYWRSTLENVQAPRSLADVPPDATDVEQIVRIPEIGASLDVEALAEHLDAEAPDVLLAALQLVIGVSSGQADVVVGTAGAGRNLRNASVSGFLVRQTPIRTELVASKPFRELVNDGANQLARAKEVGDIPVSELTALAHLPSGEPLLRHGFGWQKITGKAAALGAGVTLGLDVASQELDGIPLTSRRVRFRGSAADLSLMAAPTPTGVQASFEFRTDRLHRSTVERLAERLVAVLSAVAADPDLTLGQIGVLGDSEREILDRVDSGPEAPSHQLRVDELVRRRAVEQPDVVAVRCGADEVTYRELAARIDDVAGRLLAVGVLPGSPVAVCLPRSVEQVAAVYGVLQAGGVLVPIDAGEAAGRVATMLEGAGAVHSVGSSQTADLLRGTAMVLADAPSLEPSTRELPADDRRIDADDDLAAMIHTSGSTGTPKAVSVTHRGLANFVWSFTDRTALSPHDRVLGIVPLHFDGSAPHYFGSLTRGATLILATDGQANDAVALRGLLTDNDITYMGATPGTWGMLLDTGWAGNSEMTGVYGGEAMPRATAETLLSRLSSLWNSYGPTEATVAVTTGRVESGVGPIPLGRPHHGTDVRVVGLFENEAPVGTPGELWVTGIGLSPGYVGRPDLDQEVFVHHAGRRWYRTGDVAIRRPDGQLILGGRVDAQLNFRGVRIEPGEIEAAIVADQSIGQATVIVRDLPGGRMMLCAYVTASGDREVDVAAVRAGLEGVLPRHMVPTSFTVLDALPLTANQKIDRAALPDPWMLSADTPHREPSTNTERTLALIWAELLDLETPSVDADLFDVGGDSITATRIAARVERASLSPCRCGPSSSRARSRDSRR